MAWFTNWLSHFIQSDQLPNYDELRCRRGEHLCRRVLDTYSSDEDPAAWSSDGAQAKDSYEDAPTPGSSDWRLQSLSCDADPAAWSSYRAKPTDFPAAASGSSGCTKELLKRIRRFFSRIKASFCCCRCPAVEDWLHIHYFCLLFQIFDQDACLTMLSHFYFYKYNWLIDCSGDYIHYLNTHPSQYLMSHCHWKKKKNKEKHWRSLCCCCSSYAMLSVIIFF